MLASLTNICRGLVVVVDQFCKILIGHQKFQVKKILYDVKVRIVEKLLIGIQKSYLYKIVEIWFKFLKICIDNFTNRKIVQTNYSRSDSRKELNLIY